MIKHRNEHITTNKTSIKHMLNKIFKVIWNENIDINLRVFPLTVFFFSRKRYCRALEILASQQRLCLTQSLSVCRCAVSSSYSILPCLPSLPL